MRWPLQPLQSFQQTQLQPPFGQSVDSLCHLWFTTTNLSYRFPILKLPPPPCAVLLVCRSDRKCSVFATTTFWYLTLEYSCIIAQPIVHQMAPNRCCWCLLLFAETSRRFGSSSWVIFGGVRSLFWNAYNERTPGSTQVGATAITIQCRGVWLLATYLRSRFVKHRQKPAKYDQIVSNKHFIDLDTLAGTWLSPGLVFVGSSIRASVLVEGAAEDCRSIEAGKLHAKTAYFMRKQSISMHVVQMSSNFMQFFMRMEFRYYGL